MAIFYEPQILQNLQLNEEESRHAIKVLRLAVGDILQVVDGYGHQYETQLVEAHEKRCKVHILSEKKEEPRDFYLHLAIAPTKNMDRMEWMLEKCVEIGVEEVSFLETRYSERRELKLARLEKIAVSAMKQSQKARLPQMNPLLKWKSFLEKTKSQCSDYQKFIAHLNDDRRALFAETIPQRKYLVLIGPEGDFSTDEIQQALAAGFGPVTLGESRLRTETAGLVAIHTLLLAQQK
jgi:16S rRNA (uracil1498-N3)-methyltransferase